MKRSARLGFLSLVFCLVCAAAPAAPVQPVITGTVLGEDGRPLAGARIELLPVLPGFEQVRRGLDAVREPVPAATAATDAAGRLLSPLWGAQKLRLR